MKCDIKNELQYFKDNGIRLKVIDLPTTMMELPEGQEWVFEMVNNILIEVLGAVAEQERKKTKQRQAEGIAAMPIVNGKKVSLKTGNGFGRPKTKIDPAVFEKFAQKQKDGEMTVGDCCRELGISRSTWYDRIRKVG